MDHQNKASDTAKAPVDQAIRRIGNNMTPEEWAKRDADLERDRVESECRQAMCNLAGNLGPRYSPSRVKLDTFEVYHRDQRAVVDRLKAIAPELPERTKAGKGLVFYGTVGAGKDHLMAAMLYVVAGHGIRAKWVNGQDVYGRFRDSMDTGQREEEILQDLAAPAILAISDPIPAVGDPSPWNVSQLYRLLDRRYRSLRPTWASLNALSIEQADEKLSAPVFDRLRDSAEFFRCFWPSFRERAK